MLVCGLAPRRKWSPVCDADIFSPPSQTARREERRGASAIGPTRSNMSRLRIRTTPAASPFGEESSLYPWDSPLGKSNEFRLEHAWLDTTSNLGSLPGLEMTTQFAKGRQDHELSGAPHHRLVLQVPGMLVRDEDGVQADFHGRINVAARAVANHPAVGLDDFVLVNQAAIILWIFFSNDFDDLEEYVVFPECIVRINQQSMSSH